MIANFNQSEPSAADTTDVVLNLARNIWVKRLIIFEDAEYAVDQLSHHRDENDHFGFSIFPQACRKSFHDGIMFHRCHGWEVKNGS